MTKNLIPDICKLLGVEVGEEFKIKTSRAFYKIDSNGIVSYRHENEWFVSVRELINFLNGECEIVKLPWKPKEGEYYWTFEYDIDTVNNEPLITWQVSHNLWRKAPDDFAKFDKGWVFRTREEAEAALPKVAAELGVEYES